jgi:DNA-binding NarL/FixJ family response regulator
MSKPFSKDGLNKKSSSSKDGLPKSIFSKDGASKDGFSKDGSLKKGLSKDGASKKDLVLLLTAREKEIIKLLTDGCTNKEIAKRLKISVRTVETHRKNIMSKLNLKTLAGLIKFSIVNKLILLE